VRFEDVVIASGEEAIRLSRALEKSQEEGAKVVQEIIQSGMFDLWGIEVWSHSEERN